MTKDWKRDELFALFSKRTNRKDKENYIVNAIWQKLDNMDLQPVTQQCVLLEDGTRALIDLYFPQIKYGIECDEEYHKDNTLLDLERTKKIEHALSAVDIDKDFFLKRIDATQTLEEINKEINQTVRDIKERIDALGKPLVWKTVDERIDDVIARGSLEDKDLIPFPTHASTAKCFNRVVKPRGWQKAYFSLNEKYQLWFPILAVKNGSEYAAASSGWVNIISESWNTIIESKENKEEKTLDNNYKKDRIVFAQSKDIYGKKAYRFIGVFGYFGKTKRNGYIYIRLSSKLDLTQFQK